MMLSNLALLLSNVAFADDSLVRWAQGRFESVDSPEAIENRLEMARKKSLDASSFMVRKVAGTRLKGKPHMCRGYQIETNEQRLRITCDDKPTIDIMLDGSMTVYPNPKGKDLEIRAQVDGTTITQVFEGNMVGMTVVYTFSYGNMRVRKEIVSDYLGKPLIIEADYAQKR